ncbi:hypothetical protein [Prosthecobacter sp.]|jgi:hypothetical protein|uniref:hypothetical protein n=1 Tax=Prosthecobacter sp. TaxID=1965333 RepID=UPI00378349BC
MSWSIFDEGRSLGLSGSENGTILRDEEHSEGARITIERGGSTAPYSITCGIYGWMVHTRFFSLEEEAQTEFDKMRVELGEIIGLICDSSLDEERAMEAGENAVSRFVEQFP